MVQAAVPDRLRMVLVRLLVQKPKVLLLVVQGVAVLLVPAVEPVRYLRSVLPAAHR